MKANNIDRILKRTHGHDWDMGRSIVLSKRTTERLRAREQ